MALNPITARIENLTFNSDSFSGYAEMIADGRNIGGYLKVLFHDLDIRSFGDANDSSMATAIWGVVIKIAKNVLENTEERQHGARIPLKGFFPNPHADVWTTLGTALENAYVHALAGVLERQVQVARTHRQTDVFLRKSCFLPQFSSNLKLWPFV